MDTDHSCTNLVCTACIDQLTYRNIVLLRRLELIAKLLDGQPVIVTPDGSDLTEKIKQVMAGEHDT